MSGERQHLSWWSRITAVLTGEPQNRDELMDLIESASERGILDEDARAIIESTLTVSERLVREIMVPRAQMICLRDDHHLDDFCPCCSTARTRVSLSSPMTTRMRSSASSSPRICCAACCPVMMTVSASRTICVRPCSSPKACISTA